MRISLHFSRGVLEIWNRVQFKLLNVVWCKIIWNILFYSFIYRYTNGMISRFKCCLAWLTYLFYLKWIKLVLTIKYNQYLKSYLKHVNRLRYCPCHLIFVQNYDVRSPSLYFGINTNILLFTSNVTFFNQQK